MMTLRTADPVARKVHRCDWCYGNIQPGEKYRRTTNIYDDQLYDWVSCSQCDALAGDVWEWAYRPEEGIGEDSFSEWAHDHSEQDDRARGYLTRRGCACVGCRPDEASTDA